MLGLDRDALFAEARSGRGAARGSSRRWELVCLIALVVLTGVLATAPMASAAGNCDVPDPPPICGGGEDTTPPQTTITAGPSGPTRDTTPTYAFSSNEARSSFSCRVDNGAAVECSAPYTTPPLADGPHTFAVAATDEAGNTDATPASRSFTVGATGPPFELEQKLGAADGGLQRKPVHVGW